MKRPAARHGEPDPSDVKLLVVPNFAEATDVLAAQTRVGFRVFGQFSKCGRVPRFARNPRIARNPQADSKLCVGRAAVSA